MILLIIEKVLIQLKLLIHAKANIKFEAILTLKSITLGYSYPLKN